MGEEGSQKVNCWRWECVSLVMRRGRVRWFGHVKKLGERSGSSTLHANQVADKALCSHHGDHIINLKFITHSSIEKYTVFCLGH